jgi:hypothetical protein
MLQESRRRISADRPLGIGGHRARGYTSREMEHPDIFVSPEDIISVCTVTPQLSDLAMRYFTRQPR